MIVMYKFLHQFLSTFIHFQRDANFLNFNACKRMYINNSRVAVPSPPLFHSWRGGPNLFCHVAREEANISQRFYRAVIDKVRKKRTRTHSHFSRTYRVWRSAGGVDLPLRILCSLVEKKKWRNQKMIAVCEYKIDERTYLNIIHISEAHVRTKWWIRLFLWTSN